MRIRGSDRANQIQRMHRCLLGNLFKTRSDSLGNPSRKCEQHNNVDPKVANIRYRSCPSAQLYSYGCRWAPQET
eukprot:9535157-Alexandrium_andersonii.AAC.1